MALSSICFEGWISLGGLFGTVKLTGATATDHWNKVTKRGHYDDGIDDECAAYLDDKQRADLDALTPEAREIGRRAMVAEIEHPGFLRRLASIPFGNGRW